MKKFVLISVLISLGVYVNAQVKDDVPWQETNIVEESQPVPYVNIREADAVWGKRLWRIIDLREKMNHPLYYPTVPQGKLISLGQVIFDAILKDGLMVYEDTWLDVPKTIMVTDTIRQAKSELDEYGEIVETGELTEDVKFLKPDKIYKYKLRETWFFDKQRSSLHPQIMAICPIIDLTEFNANRYAEMGDIPEDVLEGLKEGDRNAELGWIQYRELRPYLAKYYSYNTRNISEGTSYDDILTWQRHFNSYVYTIGNVYDNREINSYIKNPWDQILESEKIIDEIRTFEHDLWEF